MEKREPIVRLIGATQFFGVPPELLPDDPKHLAHMANVQDVGTDGERLIECAGRNCYDSYGRGRSSEEYHKHIVDVANGSVTEHVSLNFYVDNVSRGFSHELVRHRIGVAYSQRSTRYVDESESPWIWHPLIFKALEEEPSTQAECIIAAIERLELQSRAVYRELVVLVTNYLERLDVGATNARKQARGAARGALGNALCTAIICTFNVRTLRNVVEQRLSEFADGEMRQVALLAYQLGKQQVPAYFEDYQLTECADGIAAHASTDHRKI